MRGERIDAEAAQLVEALRGRWAILNNLRATYSYQALDEALNAIRARKDGPP